MMSVETRAHPERGGGKYYDKPNNGPCVWTRLACSALGWARASTVRESGAAGCIEKVEHGAACFQQYD